MEEEMQKVKIAVGKIYEKDNNKVNTGHSRAARFSVFIHKHDGDLKEGNSIRALNWAKGFRVK